MVSNTAGIINQISHNPLRRGPSLGLVRTRSAGRGASIGVTTPMLTVPGSEGERGEGVRWGCWVCMCVLAVVCVCVCGGAHEEICLSIKLKQQTKPRKT